VRGFSYRLLRLVALLETVSFALLIVASVAKRTTDTDLVPVLGPIHGVLYLALVLLVLDNLRRLRWAPWFTLVMLTVGSPGAHFAVAATTPHFPAATRRGSSSRGASAR
jgi:integral membrane protein